MKDALIFERKIFISAKRAAEVSGYAPDYIGQLCRANKLECRMVGRSWFVTEESLLEHRIATSQIIKEDPMTKTPQVSDVVSGDDKLILEIPSPAASRQIESSLIPASFVPHAFALPHAFSLSFTSAPTYKKDRSRFLISFSEFGITLAVLAFAFVFLYQSILPGSYSAKNQTASLVSTSQEIISEIISSFSSIPKFFAGIFNRDSQKMAADVDKPPPQYRGLAVVPSTNSAEQDEEIKRRIKDSFSDEVEVRPDKDGTAGVITPVFKKAKSDDFLYVLVPIDNNSQ